MEEYEGTSALKELSLQASVARPEARTLQKDMADLYEYKYCTDVDLIFQETCFPVHRAILAARCPFFKTLLSSSPEYGAEIIMDINTAGIDTLACVHLSLCLLYFDGAYMTKSFLGRSLSETLL